MLPLVDPRAESAMESEARLAMFAHGLPAPELQYLIRSRRGECWRVDFAWPRARVAVEYDSIEWHAGRAEMIRDRMRFAGVQDAGWIVVRRARDKAGAKNFKDVAPFGHAGRFSTLIAAWTRSSTSARGRPAGIVSPKRTVIVPERFQRR